MIHFSRTIKCRPALCVNQILFQIDLIPNSNSKAYQCTKFQDPSENITEDSAGQATITTSTRRWWRSSREKSSTWASKLLARSSGITTAILSRVIPPQETPDGKRRVSQLKTPTLPKTDSQTAPTDQTQSKSVTRADSNGRQESPWLREPPRLSKPRVSNALFRGSTAVAAQFSIYTTWGSTQGRMVRLFLMIFKLNQFSKLRYIWFWPKFIKIRHSNWPDLIIKGLTCK